MKRKILLVDGYNMLAFWEETKPLFKKGELDVARNLLLNRLSDYASFEKLDTTVVFDAMHVPGVRLRYDHYNLTVVFTEEEETADSYIERRAAELNQGQWTVSVATSDLNEQWTIFSQGALRVSARELEQRVRSTQKTVHKTNERRELFTTPRLGHFDQGQITQLQDFMKDL
ncbi:NYN domain-containing protein [Streptococcus caprae]|uniref:NYN domain-containing protein n=1 Tax=Streptococcus caprae TaxID=1640501 RepID=A0ABV8CUC8_9STRE